MRYLFLLLLLTSCQTPPTRTVEGPRPFPFKNQASLEKDLKNFIIFDVRPLFEYTNSHVLGSTHLEWKAFSECAGRDLTSDPYFLARRLARLGVTPQGRILVLGMGTQGQGEEASVAWCFHYLGIKSVEFAADSFVSGPRVGDVTPPRAEIPVWKPQVSESMVLDKKHPLNLSQAIFVDVRDAQDYLKTPAPAQGRWINIPWREFLNEMGRPKAELEQLLKAAGFNKAAPVIVVNGSSAPTAALSLTELGYSAHLFRGSPEELARLLNK